ncbi:hypothetical protein [Myroides odoratus]|uniref:hypothetical protein n=1 Tax=Myroides odoratus TaxID=256 RepID=UPI0039B04F7E
MMKSTKYKSSILVSIFRRKGGEGRLTQILDHTKILVSSLTRLLEDKEEILYVFKDLELNEVVVTDRRLLVKKSEGILTIEFSAITRVSIALKEEFKDRIMNKEEFTRLEIEVISGVSYIISVEKGKPFQGLYQVLDYIAMVNRSDSKV